jgi:hypothetical protein
VLDPLKITIVLAIVLLARPAWLWIDARRRPRRMAEA